MVELHNMSQVEFGIYYVPQENTTFYKKGSDIVGYDIRAEKIAQSQDVDKKHFNDEWRKNAKEYGLHMTITDIVSTESEKLPEIARHVSRLVKNVGYSKIKIKIDGANFVRNNQSILGAIVERSEGIQNLHKDLVEIQKYGDSSFYTRKAKSKPEWISTLTPVQRKNLSEYMSPYVLQEYLPHFTILNPFGGNRDNIINDVNNLLVLPISFDLQSVTIVQRGVGEKFFKIYEEIPVVN